MKRHLGIVVLAFLVVLVLLIYTVAYKVDFTEYALIKTFGRTTRVVDGRTEAGLKFKWFWPIQRLVRYDARTLLFEDTASEVPTRDKQNMLVTMYCAWRIGEPKKFHSSIETIKDGQERIRDLLRSAKKDVVGRHNMEDFVNTDPEKMQIRLIEQEVLEPVRRRAIADYGVTIVRVGIKSLGLPQSVTETVIEAMKEERQRDVRRFESAGEAQATAIRERAKAASGQIVAFAQRKAQEIRTAGDRAAAEYYKDFAENEEFSMFLRSLESLRTELKSRAVIILDGTQVPAAQYFRTGPTLAPFEKMAHPAATEQETQAADSVGLDE